MFPRRLVYPTTRRIYGKSKNRQLSGGSCGCYLPKTSKDNHSNGVSRFCDGGYHNSNADPNADRRRLFFGFFTGRDIWGGRTSGRRSRGRPMEGPAGAPPYTCGWAIECALSARAANGTQVRTIHSVCAGRRQGRGPKFRH